MPDSIEMQRQRYKARKFGYLLKKIGSGYLFLDAATGTISEKFGFNPLPINRVKNLLLEMQIDSLKAKNA